MLFGFVGASESIPYMRYSYPINRADAVGDYPMQHGLTSRDRFRGFCQELPWPATAASTAATTTAGWRCVYADTHKSTLCAYIKLFCGKFPPEGLNI